MRSQCKLQIGNAFTFMKGSYFLPLASILFTSSHASHTSLLLSLVACHRQQPCHMLRAIDTTNFVRTVNHHA